MVIITTDLKILFPCLITAVIFLIIGFFIRKYTSEKKIGTAETYVKELIEKSQKDAEAQKKGGTPVTRHALLYDPQERRIPAPAAGSRAVPH